jgi:hypothetical protein
MENGSTATQPPITQLRPLHTCQQSAESSNGQLLHWISSFQPRPNQDIAVKAFVKLVSQLIILDEGESFCVKDSQRGGYTLARSGSEDIELVKCNDEQDIPTDFSIGEDKVSLRSKMIDIC